MLLKFPFIFYKCTFYEDFTSYARLNRCEVVTKEKFIVVILVYLKKTYAVRKNRQRIILEKSLCKIDSLQQTFVVLQHSKNSK